MRHIVMLLVVVSGFAPAADAGPFRDFSREVKRGFNELKQTARSNKPAHRQTAHNSTPHSAAGSSIPNRKVSGPPNGGNTRSAHVAHSAKATTRDLPYGTPVPGKKGFVTSPFAPASGYIDARDFPPGTKVKDPYSGKIFLTP